MPFTYKYPRPCVTVDIAIVRPSPDGHEILLIQRVNPPFEGMWALPGGFIDMDEDLETSASRELEEETGIKNVKLTQFKTYGAPERDPRHRTITVVYYGFVIETTMALAGDDAKSLGWFNIKQLPGLAFDHNLILSDLIQYLNL
ncbi:MAG: 8-oxo-dGTP diphosphatase [Bacteroidales bacterium]|nr:8-oxo-dGTP diphosphatase [Bacteroidales bacterium]MDN5328402.1 8-oxo-dGTP diphosphatase [Bacteroidales bacterium]